MTATATAVWKDASRSSTSSARPGEEITLFTRTMTIEAYKHAPLPDALFQQVNPAKIDAYHGDRPRIGCAAMTAIVEGLTPLATGFCFGEGPRWFEGLLWFSDMLGEAVHTVTLSGSMTTLPLPGHSPSGLGFRPDGSLLIVSTEDRRLLRYDGDTVDTVADLSALAPADLGDMVIDSHGRAYIGSQAFQGGVILRVDPDDTVSVVARDLDFPNGMVITPDHRTLIVAESIGRRLTAFSIGDDGAIVRSTSLRRWSGRAARRHLPRRRGRGVDGDDPGAPVRAH